MAPLGAKGLARPRRGPALKERIEQVMSVTVGREMEQLERCMVFLATVGSTAPFIGLFGTVWGIMNSFAAIAGIARTPTSRWWRRASPRRCSRRRSAWWPRSRR